MAKYVKLDLLCGTTDDSGTYVSSPAEDLCNLWQDMCTNGIPQIATMCAADYSTVPTDVDIWGICWSMSSAFVPEYEELVSDDICNADSSQVQYLCVEGKPHKGELCALWD